MNRRGFPLLISLIFAVLAAAVRAWSLVAAVDSDGLPMMHLSIYILIAAAVVVLVAAALLSQRAGGLAAYGSGPFYCGAAGGALLALSAVLDFTGSLRSGPSMGDTLLTLLGLAGGISMVCAAASRRKRGGSMPPAELLPCVFLLMKTMLRFRSWSTDPIILDYCIRLFGMLFGMAASCLSAGFAFGAGKPRRTLFAAMGAVFFCAAAMMDGVLDRSAGELTFYAGVLLWQLPVIWSLSSQETEEGTPGGLPDAGTDGEE